MNSKKYFKKYRNYLFTVPRSEWTGCQITECGCPTPRAIWGQMFLGAKSLQEANNIYPWKKIGSADDILVGLCPDPCYGPSQDGLQVIAEGPYEIMNIVPGCACRMAIVYLLA